MSNLILSVLFGSTAAGHTYIITCNSIFPPMLGLNAGMGTMKINDDIEKHAKTLNFPDESLF
jgi:hypothetical protein